MMLDSLSRKKRERERDLVKRFCFGDIVFVFV